MSLLYLFKFARLLLTCDLRLLRLRGAIARALPKALPEKSMRAIYHTPKICKFPHL